MLAGTGCLFIQLDWEDGVFSKMPIAAAAAAVSCLREQPRVKVALNMNASTLLAGFPMYKSG